MKKTAIFILLVMLTLVLVSCGKQTKVLDEVAGFFNPPATMTATVKSNSTTAKMNVEIFDPESDVVMRTTFSEPETLKGLVVERRKDGKLIAGYKGIKTELDQNALKFIAATHDILREVSLNLGEYGKLADSPDERYGKAVISVNEGEISVFYDLETNKPMRIDSNLFDLPLRIDIIKLTPGTGNPGTSMPNTSKPAESLPNTSVPHHTSTVS